MGCVPSGSWGPPAAPGGVLTPPLPTCGAHDFHVACTGRSASGARVKQPWNSNKKLLWRVAAAGGAGGGEEEARAREDWFYITTSTDLYHFGVFMDTWACVHAYGHKGVAAEVRVQLGEKEQILRCAIFVAGKEELTLVRVGTGPAAQLCVEPGAARPGDFAWSLDAAGACRWRRPVLAVTRTDDGLLLRAMEDDAARLPVAAPLLLLAMGFVLGCGLLNAADTYFRSGLAPGDARDSGGRVMWRERM